MALAVPKGPPTRDMLCHNAAEMRGGKEAEDGILITQQM